MSNPLNLPNSPNTTYEIVVHLSPQEERLAYIYNFLYPAWKTVLYSWLISVLMTAAIMALFLPGDLKGFIVGLSIASVCSISISYSVSRVAYTYQSLLADKNEMLLAYAGELTHANKELDAFARTVAHDLKSPIANIIGYTSLIQDDLAELQQDELQELLYRVYSQGELSIRIIDSILLFSRARTLDVDMQPIDMQDAVQNALIRLTELVSSKNATIEYPDQWPVAVGYGPWVEEIWVNYISNALKYGGKPPKLTLGASFEEGTVQFWVEDNGKGLTAAQQEQLFVEFTRLDTEAAEGHGLGLSIVERIGQRLGGEVGVESRLGYGSRFYFTLPASARFVIWV